MLLSFCTAFLCEPIPMKTIVSSMLRVPPIYFEHPPAGQVGPISKVSSPDLSIAASTSSSVNTLVVNWQHETVPDGYAAKEASYTLYRYPTGSTDSTKELVCTAEAVSTMDSATYNPLSTTELQTTVDVCAVNKPLDKGRCGDKQTADNR